MLRFSWAAQSHVGLVRENNEDSGFAGPYLLLVADGVGGHAAGEIASASTAYVVASLAMADVEQNLLEVLGDAVDQSNRHLQDGVRADASRAGMATTLTSVMSDGERFALAHIGDSRGYLLRDGAITRITTDHTIVQHLVDERQITREEATRHPYRSVVLRSIDGEHQPDPELTWLDLREHDRLMLCSDGLSDLVPEETIGVLLATPDLDQAVAHLVGAALEAGGRDNITCVGADVVVGPKVRPDGSLVGAVRDIGNLIDPAVVHVPKPA